MKQYLGPYTEKQATALIKEQEAIDLLSQATNILYSDTLMTCINKLPKNKQNIANDAINVLINLFSAEV